MHLFPNAITKGDVNVKVLGILILTKVGEYATRTVPGSDFGSNLSNDFQDFREDFFAVIAEVDE